MTNQLKFGMLCTLAVGATTLNAQPRIPTRTLSKPDVTSVQRFGAIESVHALSDGTVLVNDTRSRQLILFDSALQSSTIALDSATTAAVHYADHGTPLISYRADSTIILDATSSFYVVVDPKGNVVRRFSMSKPEQAPMAIQQPRGFDASGNAITNAVGAFRPPRHGQTNASGVTEIVRVNFSTRQYEPLGNVQTVPLMQMNTESDNNGKMRATATFNPLVINDDWAVLSDGTVSFVRGHDYKVEFVSPNGRKFSSGKLPFAKVKLSNDDKQRICTEEREAMREQSDDGIGSSLNSAAAVVSSMLSPEPRLTCKSNGPHIWKLQPVG